MEVKEFLEQLKDNKPDIFEIFEKQDGNALDVKNVSELNIKQCEKLNKFNVNFVKNGKKFVLELNDVQNITIEQTKASQTQNDLCIRNGLTQLGFVAVCNNTVISCEFKSGSINKLGDNKPIKF